MNINNKSEKENTYDAIVVGTGVSGGWAAKELTEGGLKTLVLEGRMLSMSKTILLRIKTPGNYHTGIS